MTSNEQLPQKGRKALAAILASVAVSAGVVELFGEGHMQAEDQHVVSAPTQWEALNSTEGALNQKDRVGYLMRQVLGRESIEDAGQSGLHVVPGSVEVIDNPLNPFDDLKKDTWDRGENTSTSN